MNQIRKNGRFIWFFCHRILVPFYVGISSLPHFLSAELWAVRGSKPGPGLWVVPSGQRTTRLHGRQRQLGREVDDGPAGGYRSLESCQLIQLSSLTAVIVTNSHHFQVSSPPPVILTSCHLFQLSSSPAMSHLLRSSQRFCAGHSMWC
jgi:hypothetical protein